MKRALFATVLVAATLPVATAEACSCVAPGDPREELAENEAAMYGKVVGRQVVRHSAFDATVRYRVRVIRDYKDNLGGHFRFRSNTQSAACGVEFARGERFGTLLNRYQGRWSVSSCSLRSRAQLEAGVMSVDGEDDEAGVVGKRLRPGVDDCALDRQRGGGGGDRRR